jgi:hypothetical protein
MRSGMPALFHAIAWQQAVRSTQLPSVPEVPVAHPLLGLAADIGKVKIRQQRFPDDTVDTVDEFLETAALRVHVFGLAKAQWAVSSSKTHCRAARFGDFYSLGHDGQVSRSKPLKLKRIIVLA